jgi:hypothetical protein
VSRKPNVGYGHPPVEHQFRKGQSGNPAGRPKGSRNMSTLIQKALFETVVVNVNGRRKKVSKLEAAFIQQANRAAGGDAQATRLMLDVLVGSEQREEARTRGETETPEARHAQDLAIIQTLKARLGGGDNDS